MFQRVEAQQLTNGHVDGKTRTDTANTTMESPSCGVFFLVVDVGVSPFFLHFPVLFPTDVQVQHTEAGAVHSAVSRDTRMCEHQSAGFTSACIAPPAGAATVPQARMVHSSSRAGRSHSDHNVPLPAIPRTRVFIDILPAKTASLSLSCDCKGGAPSSVHGRCCCHRCCGILLPIFFFFSVFSAIILSPEIVSTPCSHLLLKISS
mmetsp:Transcript_53307/g.105707  ORF Transcript_53307/g.105707 Transcript_53307/m.105707 type:complete len:205 (+) Transcript_53307:91-705(+)